MNNLKKSNTNLLKPFLCGILISGIMVSSMTFTNAASFSTGPVSYYTANGITYNTYNTIYTGKNAYNQKYANAMMTANAKNQATIPAGWAGTLPILYNSSGTAVKTGDWTYSSSGSSGLGSTISYTGFTNSDSYYAKGITRAWNGSDYWTYSSSKSPNLNDFTV